MSGRTGWRSAWLPVAFWLIVIFAVSSVPDLGPPDVGLPMSDKLAHLGEYGIFGLLLGRAGPGTGSRRRALLIGALAGVAIGAIDETYQRGTPGREVSAFDAMADTLGAALGCWFSSLWAGWRTTRGAKGSP